MYIQRTRLAPALGKVPEVRRLVVDNVKHQQGKGQRIALSERIFSSEGPMLLVTQMAPEIADIERVRRSRLTDTDWQARAGQIVALLSEPPRATLWESVVEPQPNPATVTIGQLVFFHPAIGKQRQMEELLTEPSSSYGRWDSGPHFGVRSTARMGRRSRWSASTRTWPTWTSHARRPAPYAIAVRRRC